MTKCSTTAGTGAVKINELIFATRHLFLLLKCLRTRWEMDSPLRWGFADRRSLGSLSRRVFCRSDVRLGHTTSSEAK